MDVDIYLDADQPYLRISVVGISRDSQNKIKFEGLPKNTIHGWVPFIALKRLPDLVLKIAEIPCEWFATIQKDIDIFEQSDS